MPTPLTEIDALALVLLINQIPACSAGEDHDIRMTWLVHASSAACDCAWTIKTVEDGLRFITMHFEGPHGRKD